MNRSQMYFLIFVLGLWGCQKSESIKVAQPPESPPKTEVVPPSENPTTSSQGTVAGTESVTKIFPALDSRGVAQLELHYGYDSERDYFWSFSMSTNFTNQDYENWPGSIWWRIIDLNDGRVYRPWSSLSKESLRNIHFSIGSGARLTQFLPRMRSSRIEISFNQVSPAYVVDLRDICDRFPANIKDFTNPQQPPCTVYDFQLPGNERSK